MAQKFPGASTRQELPGIAVLSFLAQDNVTDEARYEVLDRVSQGEKIGTGKARQIANEHRLPKPKAANEQA